MFYVNLVSNVYICCFARCKKSKILDLKTRQSFVIIEIYRLCIGYHILNTVNINVASIMSFAINIYQQFAKHGSLAFIVFEV